MLMNTSRIMDMILAVALGYFGPLDPLGGLCPFPFSIEKNCT